MTKNKFRCRSFLSCEYAKWDCTNEDGFSCMNNGNCDYCEYKKDLYICRQCTKFKEELTDECKDS
ncbi:MAG: hypothetical protein J5994_10700 [Ruminococcus sp.]|nr:hypothetical protein [Ruminococcus sp.]